jgi:aminoglycoside phosphotransferase (APT) family kinase protein
LVDIPDSGKRMRHGYTNAIHHVAGLVTKTYRGPDVVDRQDRELQALRTLAGRLPVPEVVRYEPGMLTTSFVQGVHGQELLEAGRGEQVLLTCGRLLADLQGIHVEGVDQERGVVLVHGDFGPNNMLMNDAATEVRLLCDWEWSGVGSRLTDLAWCEWIIRMHHQDQIPRLSALFEGYGAKPVWPERRQAMLDRTARHLDFTRRWPTAKLVSTWEERLATVAKWSESG